jgi:ABC-type transporter Mla MlaB component
MAENEPILLDERMGLAQARKFHPLFAAALLRGGAISIDGSRVQQIDGSSLQLLVSLWRTATDQGMACGWSGASDWLRHAARLIGVAEALQLPEQPLRLQ